MSQTAFAPDSVLMNRADVNQAQFDRDMTRLSDLYDHYQHPGLNSIESNEVQTLVERYQVDYKHWCRGDFPSDD